jgi:hypothetical protein
MSVVNSHLYDIKKERIVSAIYKKEVNRSPLSGYTIRSLRA